MITTYQHQPQIKETAKSAPIDLSFPLFLLTVCGLVLVPQVGEILAWALICVRALRSVDNAIESLIASMMIIYLNSGIFTNISLATAMRWLILLIAFGRVCFEYRKLDLEVKVPSWLKLTFVFICYVGVAAYLRSAVPSASYIKAGTYFLVLLTAYYGFQITKKNWLDNIVLFGLVIVTLSVPTIFSSVGFLRNGTQFQGMLSHPQTYGGILCFCLLAYMMQLGRLKEKIWMIPIVVVMYITILMSGARTGYFAFVLAIGMSVLLYPKRIKVIEKVIGNPLLYFGIVLALVFFWANPEFLDQVVFERSAEHYYYYNLPINVENSLFGRFLASRATLVNQSWQNIIQYPFLGIGFGMPSDIDTIAERIRYLYGIPISLPAEKGFIVTALLEEVGLIGTVLFCIILMMQIAVVRHNEIEYIAIFFIALLTNLGEFVIFAPGGVGLMVTLMLCLALANSPAKPTWQYAIEQARNTQPVAQPSVDGRLGKHPSLTYQTHQGNG